MKKEEERKREESERRRKADEEEKAKFENRFPFLAKYYHVPSWAQELNTLCATADLADMEKFFGEMLNGQHLTEFPSKALDFNDAVSYLNIRIGLRKSKLDPEQEKIRLLRETKAETAANKKHLEEISEQVAATQHAAQVLLKPHIDRATKAYTA